MTVRPRMFYRVNTDAVGCPVFLANGKLLGISVLRQPKGRSAGSGQIQVTPVILPAADVAKIAAQAKEAQPAAPAPAAEPEAAPAAEEKPAAE